jgi:hypothetical protein
MRFREFNSVGRRARVELLLVYGLLIGITPCAFAHNGPPFPIIENRQVGPVVISVWTNPDVGKGSFFVMIDQPAGGTIPNDMKVDIAVQPLSGRLPEKSYATTREILNGQTAFKTLVPFDKQEMWRVRVRLTSAMGGGEAVTNVKVTPAGFGNWDMLLYLLPFLAIGFLWFKAATRERISRRPAISAESKVIETGTRP